MLDRAGPMTERPMPSGRDGVLTLSPIATVHVVPSPASPTRRGRRSLRRSTCPSLAGVIDALRTVPLLSSRSGARSIGVVVSNTSQTVSPSWNTAAETAAANGNLIRRFSPWRDS